MFGGYLRETQSRRIPIPLRVDRAPHFGRGKYTTAYDLAQLLAYVHLASEGKGRLSTYLPAREARHLLYLLAHVADRDKLGRSLPANTALLHKAGWISTSRHDAGLVYYPGGVYVAVVMTYGMNESADALAGRIAALTLRLLRSSRAS
jgi:beta-lactamase class A